LAATYCQLAYGTEKLGDLALAVKFARHVTDPEWSSVLTEQRVAEAEERVGVHEQGSNSCLSRVEVYKRLRGWKTGDFNSSSQLDQLSCAYEVVFESEKLNIIFSSTT
jgi:hypothetical protein